MLKRDGLSELLQEESKTFGDQSQSFNGSLEQSGIRPGRKLTRSRSIPSDFSGDNATPVFPGPLLPTVRRLNSSPKTVATEPGDSGGTTGKAQRDKKDCLEKSETITDVDGEDQTFQKEIEVKSPQSVVLDDVRSEKPILGGTSAVNLKALDGKPPNFTSDSVDSVRLSPSLERVHVKSRSQEHVGVFERSETAKILASSSGKNLGSDLNASFKNLSVNVSQGQQHLQEKGKPKGEALKSKSLDDPERSQQARHPWKPRPKADINRSDRSPRVRLSRSLRIESSSPENAFSNGLRDPFIPNYPISSPQKLSDSVRSFTKKREAITEVTSVQSNFYKQEEKSISDANSIESRNRHAASASKSLFIRIRKFFGVISLLSKVKVVFGKRFWFIWSIALNFLLLMVCILSSLYALSMHDQVMLLKGEVMEYQEKIRTCSHCDVVAERWPCEVDSIMNLENSLDRGLRKFVLCFTIFFLSMPFLLYKYIDELPQLVGKSKKKNLEEEVPLSKRVAYRVDVLFSTHAFVKPIALLLATMLLIMFGGVALFSVSDDSLWDNLWQAWTYVADAGNHADSTGVGPRVVSVCISLGGLLIFALMLGLVSDAISEKVDSLRKGKSEVIESNHTLILGWSDKLGSLLKQLATANQSLGGGVVVVLAERDKEQMELDIAKLEFDFRGTSVICRSGSPLIMADLKKVSVSKARSIIVLAEVENADQSDARALRVVLSLTGVKEGLRGHVVVELSDLDNEPLVKLVGGEMVETVVAHDVIGRLMIQCARQPGLAQIWEDVLGFDNAEFYVKRWPQLDGMCFRDVLISFPDAIPCGVRVAANGGKIVLNPEDDYIFSEGDELLVIAEDDDTYCPGPLPQLRKGVLPKIVPHRKYPEKILFCGWRRDIDDMIMVLEAFLAVGSELWMFSEVPEKERKKKLLDGGLDPNRLENIRLVHREGNAVIRRHLESLPLETFDSILILADEALEDSVVNADSRSLATLLLIRDIQSKRLPYRDAKAVDYRRAGSSQTSWIREMQQASNKSIIISEILDSRTKNLVSVSKISDYVLSNELVSMALAMVSEDKQINRVLEELFAEEGNEMYIRPAEFYLYDKEELSFYDIMVRARRRDEIVIGYRLASSERAIINPPNKMALSKWSLGDVFIVLSQEE